MPETPPHGDTPGRSYTTLGFHWDSPPTSGGARQDTEDSRSEERFRHFLTVQRQRSDRSGRPFCVLLVELKDPAGQSLAMDRPTASAVFAGLRRCLRETDVVGWYRTDWAAGAVLTELGDGSGAASESPVDQRVKDTISRQLPPGAAREPQVTIYQLGPTLQR